MTKSNRKNAWNRTAHHSSTKKARPLAHKTTDEGTAGNQIVSTMSPALRAAYIRVRIALASATTTTIEARHKAGLEVLKVLNQKTRYGEHAVRKIETALGLDVKTLYRWGVVARAWPSRTALRQLLAMRTPFGVPPRWSHLELIAAIPTQKRRQSMLEKALRMNLSVRQLDDMIKGIHRSTDSKPLMQDDSDGSVENEISTLTRQAEEMGYKIEDWKAAISRLPVGAPAPKTVDLLKRAQDVQRRLRATCDVAIAEIAAVLSRAQQAAAPAPTASTVASATA